ncbi:F-box protein PP2-A13-like [Chenopodium quinoa]|uniref:F-box protein PP2-A13-like n=1 Tax=Chenopodium quinoa TaxID=63459 RepID=UPI000B76ED32|nr:F-box protein PP2-A13-like [Chenopodium quinoa]
MGSGQSGLRSTGRIGLGDLPESCVAVILGQLSPPEICRLSEVNWAFYEASLSDFVWETKLPSNFEFLVRKLFDESPKRFSKREIFSRLSRSVRFDAGTKEIWLEKNSGKMCMAISWRGMTITGIDDRRYWTHISTHESRFQAIAYLKQVWWLEVGGELEFNFPAGTYSLFFRLQLGKPSKRFGRRICNTEGVHGWDRKPVRFKLSASNGQDAVSQCYLKPAGNWLNYHAGDFTVENHHTPMKIKFSLAQIDCTHTKGGLCLDSVVIYPSELAERMQQSQLL